MYLNRRELVMNCKETIVLILSIWDDDEAKYIVTCNIEKTYDLTKKDDLKKLAIDSVNYLVKGYKIELISVCYDFITMISKYENLYLGYTNRDEEYHEFTISNVVFPSVEYGFKYFDAFCTDEDGRPEGSERTFKIERIEFIKNSQQEKNSE